MFHGISPALGEVPGTLGGSLAADEACFSLGVCLLYAPVSPTSSRSSSLVVERFGIGPDGIGDRIEVDWFLSVMADSDSIRSGFLIFDFGADLAGV